MQSGFAFAKPHKRTPTPREISLVLHISNKINAEQLVLNSFQMDDFKRISFQLFLNYETQIL